MRSSSVCGGGGGTVCVYVLIRVFMGAFACMYLDIVYDTVYFGADVSCSLY